MHQNDFDVSEKSNHLIFSGSKKEQISTCNSLRWVLQNTAVILTQKSNIEYTLHSQNLAQHMGGMECIQDSGRDVFLKAWSISSKYLCGQKQKKCAQQNSQLHHSNLWQCYQLLSIKKSKVGNTEFISDCSRLPKKTKKSSKHNTQS